MPGGQTFAREASEIIPRLYLSDALTARWGDTLDRLGVTHIVCVLEEPVNYPRTKQDIKILHIPLPDDPRADLLSYLPSVTEFMTEALGTMDIANVDADEVRELNEVTNVLEESPSNSSPSNSFSPFKTLARSLSPTSEERATKKKNVVLVHCLAGMSRSASCVIAYLLATTSMNTAEAMAYVKARRPIIMPNYGFEHQLRQWEAKHFVATRKRRVSSKQIAMGLQGRIERYKMATKGTPAEC